MRRLLCGIACAGCLVLSGCVPGAGGSSAGNSPAGGEMIPGNSFWIGNEFCGYDSLPDATEDDTIDYECFAWRYKFLEKDVIMRHTFDCEKRSQQIGSTYKNKYKLTHNGTQMLIYDPRNLKLAQRYIVDYEKKMFRRARKEHDQPEELWNMRD